MERQQLLELITEYTLGTLSDEEQQALESLLATDIEAQKLLHEYQTVADTLVFSARARQAPAHLSVDLRQRLRENSLADDSTMKKTDQPLMLAQSPIRKRWAIAAVAATLILLIGFVFAIQQIQMQPTGERLYQQLSAEPGTSQLTLVPDINDRVNGELLIGNDGQRAVIRVQQLPQIEADQAFQLWLIREDGSASGGVFQFANPSVTNYISIPLQESASSYQAFGVSIEPAAGSPLVDRPTGPRVFSVQVPALP